MQPVLSWRRTMRSFPRSRCCRRSAAKDTSSGRRRELATTPNALGAVCEIIRRSPCPAVVPDSSLRRSATTTPDALDLPRHRSVDEHAVILVSRTRHHFHCDFLIDLGGLSDADLQPIKVWSGDRWCGVTAGQASCSIVTTDTTAAVSSAANRGPLTGPIAVMPSGNKAHRLHRRLLRQGRRLDAANQTEGQGADVDDGALVAVACSLGGALINERRCCMAKWDNAGFLVVVHHW